MPCFTKEKKPEDNTNQTDENGANEMKKQLPFQSSYNLVWTFPLLALTIVPSILNITFAVGSFMQNSTTSQNNTAFSQYDPQIGYAVIGSILLLLAMIYSISILIIYRVKNLLARNLSYYLALNWATGPFGACVVIRPESNLLFLTSTVSTCCHLLLLGTLYIIQYYKLIDVQVAADITRTATLAGFLVLSWISSFVLQVLSSEKKRQMFGLRVMRRSLSCPYKDAFLWACQNNYHDLLKFCSQEHLEATDPEGQLTGMHIASKEGHLETVKVLIEHQRYHFLLRELSFNRDTPFTWACKMGKQEVVSFMARIGDEKIAVDARNKFGEPGFILACTFGQLGVVNCLLELEEGRVNINTKSNTGITGFIIACWNGHLNIVNRLLDLEDGRVDINAKTKRGSTGFILACQEGHLGVVNRLLELEEGRVDINAKTNFGMTGFIWACRNGHLSVVTALLEMANIDTTGGLEEAERRGHSEIVEAIRRFRAQ